MRDAIIENAIALFREHGFEATPVREISRRCEISDATFFNYFQTKDAVLSAWAHRLVSDAFGRMSENAGGSLRRAVRGAAAELAATIEADWEFSRRVWARARAAAPVSEAAIELVRAAQAREEVRRDIGPETLVGMLASAFTGTIASELAAHDAPGGLSAALRATADLMLDGARRRNERVSAPAASPISTR